jgi:UDP-N-acetylmuramyl tripeptide synthase
MRTDGSRRITGPHPWIATHGAAIEIEGVAHADAEAWIASLVQWQDRLPWITAPFFRWAGEHLTLALEAPIDQLDTAATLLDHVVLGEPADGSAVLGAAAAEASPRLVAAWHAADGPAFVDEDGLTIGVGQRARTWPLDALPEPGDAHPAPGDEVPFVFITGTNGKTTTARLLADMARAAGHTVGLTSSDAIVIGDDPPEPGDWTGPGAARRVLRDPRVSLAVLETARGGLMRRGLVARGAKAALVTNISADHLGEWGLETLEDLADAKLSVRRGLARGAPLWVPEAAQLLRARPLAQGARTFGRDGPLAAVVGDVIVYEGHPVASLHEVPLLLGGAATFHLDNALAALTLAATLGLPWDAVRTSLLRFGTAQAPNPGRTERYAWRGRTVLVDFAHNPDGLMGLLAVARGLGQRLHLLLGQAGDRTDAEVVALARVAREAGLTRIQLKRLPEHARGRHVDETVALLRAALEGGATPVADPVGDDEASSAWAALHASQPGDVVVLPLHEQRDALKQALARG